MVLVGGDRLVVRANQAFLRLIGRPSDAVIGHPVYEFVAGGPHATANEWAVALAASEFTGETQLQSPDGTTTLVEYGAATEVVTGHKLVLFVVLRASTAGGQPRIQPRATDEQAPLTPRERQIVGLVAEGRSGPEIAAELHITHDTVRTHVRNAMAKVGARSRAHLVATTLGEGHAFP